MLTKSKKVDHPDVRASLWHNRDYLLLWSGQAVSSIGSQASLIAFPLLTLFLTGSPAQAGLVGALRALPYVFFSLPAGAFIDRWDRKKTMIVCDTARACVLGSIPLAYLFGHLTVIQIYWAALIEGTFYVFFNIAEAACLPRVVPKESLPAATAQNQAADGFAVLVGPSLGGVLYAISHFLPFLADAFSYAISALSLLFVKTSFHEERDQAPRQLWQEIAEGVTWLWQQRLIRLMALLNAGFNLLIAGAPLIIIVQVQHQGASPQVIGLIFAIAASGGIVGSLMAPWLQKRFTFGQIIIANSWVRALLWPLCAIAPNPFILSIIAALLFICIPIYSVVQFSFRISLIPDRLQGRVNSAFRLIAFSLQPLGSGIAGLLLVHAGIIPTILIFAVFLVFLAIITHLSRVVRNAST